MGQSGDGPADDEALPDNRCPCRPAERPPQAGGGVCSSPGPRWTGRRRVEGGGQRRAELLHIDTGDGIKLKFANTPDYVTVQTLFQVQWPKIDSLTEQQIDCGPPHRVFSII